MICPFVRVNAANEKAISNQQSAVSLADTTLVNTYIKLCFEDKTNNPFAIYYSFEALELAKKLKYKKGADKILKSLQSTVHCPRTTMDYSQFSVLSSQISVLILYDSLGYYYSNAGQQYKALECFRVIERITRINTNNTNERLKRSVLNGIAGCYKRIGIQYVNQQDYEISIEYSNKALQIYKRLENKLGIGGCYNNIGFVYINSGNNLLALDYFLKSLKIFEELKDKIGLANSNQNIGLVYTNEKDNSKALDYELKALKIYEEIKDKEGVFKCYVNLGNTYSNQGNYIKAIEFCNHALKMSEELQDERIMTIILNNIGDNYVNLGEYSRSLKYFNTALKLNQKNDDKINKVYLLNNIANIYLKLKRYNEALEYALESSKSAKELKQLVIENDGYRILKEIYKLKGNSNKALEYADLYKITSDSLYNSGKSKQILEIQNKYETEKKDKAILLLNKNNESNTGKIGKQKVIMRYMYGGFIVLVILIILIFRNMKIKNRNKKLIEKLHQQEKFQIKSELEVKEAELERNKTELELNKAYLERNKAEMELKNKDLELKNKNLEHFALRIVDKNEFIENIEKEVDALEGSEKDKKQLLNITNTIRQKIAHERNVFDIENKINKSYSEFFVKLNNKHPDLTKTENKICSLMLLNFDNKQIATLLNITTDSLRKDRYRLRKKLNLNPEDNTANYLKTL